MPVVDRDGVAIHYESHGKGPAVLLTHGYGASSSMWTPQLVTLAQRFRLIVWDLRGHGRSGAPEDPAAYSEALAVSDMSAILDACAAPRAVIAGLSLGGYLSLAFHLAHPERTRALMLFDTGPGYRNEEGRSRWNRLAERYAQALEAKGLDTLPASPEVRAGTHRSAQGLALAARGILAQRDSRVIDSLPSIAVSTLVLWGENDRDFVAPGEYMATKIPTARRAVIANAGHAVNVDQPGAFDSAVSSFLRSLPPEPAAPAH